MKSDIKIYFFIYIFESHIKDITMLIFLVLGISMTKFLSHVTIALLRPLLGLTAATNNGSVLSDLATLAAKKQLKIN